MTNRGPSPNRKNSTELPRQYYKSQGEADELVREALTDMLATASWEAGVARPNIVRLMFEMFWIHGSWEWPRGWCRSVMQVMDGKGMPTTPMTIRWYRSQCKNVDVRYEHISHVNAAAVEAAIGLEDA